MRHGAASSSSIRRRVPARSASDRCQREAGRCRCDRAERSFDVGEHVRADSREQVDQHGPVRVDQVAGLDCRGERRADLRPRRPEQHREIRGDRKVREFTERLLVDGSSRRVRTSSGSSSTSQFASGPQATTARARRTGSVRWRTSTSGTSSGGSRQPPPTTTSSHSSSSTGHDVVTWYHRSTAAAAIVGRSSAAGGKRVRIGGPGITPAGAR